MIGTVGKVICNEVNMIMTGGYRRELYRRGMKRATADIADADYQYMEGPKTNEEEEEVLHPMEKE